jgi:hypothetical protein
MKDSDIEELNAWAGEIQKYALENYEHGGWDSVYECWDKADIIEEIRGSHSFKDARERISRFAEAFNIQRVEVESTEW